MRSRRLSNDANGPVFVRLRLRQLQQHTAVPGRLRGPAAVELEPDLLTEPHLLRDDNLLADWQRVRRGLGRVEGGARAHDRRGHDSVASAHLRPRLWLRRSSRYRLGGPGPGLPRCLCKGLHKRRHNCLQIATTSAVLERSDSTTRERERTSSISRQCASWRSAEVI